MKLKFIRGTVASCVTVSFLALTAIGAQDTPGATGALHSGGQSPSSQPPAPTSTALLSPASSRPQNERLSHLMGSTVKDQSGNTLGQINGFVIGPRSGRIQYAIVALNDQAGKLTAVPWQLVKRGADPASCTLTVSKDKLVSAQTFDASNWPDFNQPATEQQIYSHYGVQVENMGGLGGASGSDTGKGTSNSQLNKSDNKGAPDTNGNTTPKNR